MKAISKITVYIQQEEGTLHWYRCVDVSYQNYENLLFNL